MRLKRILPSVSFLTVLSAILFTCSIWSAEAQSYKKCVELNDSLIQFAQKRTFKHAGDKLMTIETTQDTVRKTQLLTVRLLNPDFSPFKTFSRELPIDLFVMFYHNGVDVIEATDSDNPSYYWRYTNEFEKNGLYYSMTTVLNESNDSLYSIPVSFHGAKLFEHGKNIKLVGETVEYDTIHFERDGMFGYYTMQVLTSSIYDLKTGFREFSFPKGTRFNQLAAINDSVRILTENYNMSLFLDKHPFGSESTCMKSMVYNMDYSVYKELDYAFYSMGINLNNLNYSRTYEPLYDGRNLYFLHSFNSNVKDEQGGVIGYSDRFFLTDNKGDLLKMSEETTRRPSGALWLSSKQETIFFTYNGTLLSCPGLDSIGTFTDYYIKDDGSVAFVKKDSDSVKLLNEQLNVVASFASPTQEWSLSEMNQYAVVADSLLELVFINYNNGVQVFDEKGKMLVSEPDNTWRMDFMNYTPIFLMEKGHKYANVVDDSLDLWNRIAPLKAQAMQDETLLPLSLQVYRQTNDSIFMVDSVSETGSYEGMLPEGTYYVRTVSDSLPSTYYPSALLWEDATPVAFTTDSLPVLTIKQATNPKLLSPVNEGVISGSLTCAEPALLWATDLDQVRVYVVVDSEVVAVGKGFRTSYIQ